MWTVLVLLRGQLATVNMVAGTYPLSAKFVATREEAEKIAETVARDCPDTKYYVVRACTEVVFNAVVVKRLDGGT